MPSRILRWGLVVVLLAGLWWSVELMFFNIWAAGGPPTAHPEVFECRANMFF